MRDHYKHQACTKLYTMTRHHKPHAIPHSPLCFVDTVDHCENPILQNPAIPNCLMAKLSPSTTVKKFCSALAIVSYLSLQTCLGIRGMANLGCRSKHHNLCNALCSQYAHTNCTSSNVNLVLPSKDYTSRARYPMGMVLRIILRVRHQVENVAVRLR